MVSPRPLASFLHKDINPKIHWRSWPWIWNSASMWQGTFHIGEVMVLRNYNKRALFNLCSWEAVLKMEKQYLFSIISSAKVWGVYNSTLQHTSLSKPRIFKIEVHSGRTANASHIYLLCNLRCSSWYLRLFIEMANDSNEDYQIMSCRIISRWLSPCLQASSKRWGKIIIDLCKLLRVDDFSHEIMDY